LVVVLEADIKKEESVKAQRRKTTQVVCIKEKCIRGKEIINTETFYLYKLTEKIQRRYIRW